MLHHEYDALKGYRFLGGAISFYSVSCMSDVIFNPSLLNWSSLILTVAHIYIYVYCTVYIPSLECVFSNFNGSCQPLSWSSHLSSEMRLATSCHLCFDWQPVRQTLPAWLSDGTWNSKICCFVELCSCPLDTRYDDMISLISLIYFEIY